MVESIFQHILTLSFRACFAVLSCFRSHSLKKQVLLYLIVSAYSERIH